ncbi:hypothetical protein VNO80_21487 [Phaseolus coccineus]|uniref:Uncharacterized protein n=1 Tax=Phaseolus coccineus TaxID=3886 RepID=A0AAN9M7W2_PHACN
MKVYVLQEGPISPLDGGYGEAMALVAVLLEVLEEVEVAARVVAMDMVGSMELLGMEVVVADDKVGE